MSGVTAAKLSLKHFVAYRLVGLTVKNSAIGAEGLGFDSWTGEIRDGVS